jgi:hypothetical protein
MFFRAVLIAAAIATAAVGSASPAQANDQSFINYINQNGVRRGIMTDPDTIVAGHMMCDRMHGMSPADAGAMFRGPFVDGPGIVAAAQHELCPDTSH